MHPECQDTSDKNSRSVARDSHEIEQRAEVRRMKGVVKSYSAMVVCGEQIHMPPAVLEG